MEEDSHRVVRAVDVFVATQVSRGAHDREQSMRSADAVSRTKPRPRSTLSRNCCAAAQALRRPHLNHTAPHACTRRDKSRAHAPQTRSGRRGRALRLRLARTTEGRTEQRGSRHGDPTDRRCDARCVGLSHRLGAPDADRARRRRGLAGDGALSDRPPPGAGRHGRGLRSHRSRATSVGRAEDPASLQSRRRSTGSSRSFGPSRTSSTRTWCDSTSSS